MSDSNLIVLEGGQAPSREPNEELIKMLRDALELAESGRLQGLVAVGQLVDGELLLVDGGAYGPFTMAGQLEVAKRRVVSHIDD